MRVRNWFSTAGILLFLFSFAGQGALAQAKRNLSVDRADPVASEKRVALVIGNSAYRSSPLVNPVNDARTVGARLRSLGFEVVERENLTLKQVGPTLREFRAKLAPGAVALFFYAGHGVQVKGANFLPVVDADIASEEDVSLQALELGKILDLMDEAKTRLNLVFLDACRNNPYARSFRSGVNGLAKIDAPSGTLISFATRPGSIASDGKGRNGLYTEKLLQAMNETGQPIELVIKRVVSGVKAASNGQQEPWMEGSIEGDFCFGRCSGVNETSGPTDRRTIAGPVALEVTFWESVRGGGRAELLAYLDKYPNGQFARLARDKAERIRQDVVTLVAAAPKPYPGAPATHTASGMPMLYGSGALTLKDKASEAQQAEILSAYRRDADVGDAVAQFSLGSMYNVGLGVPEDKVEAYRWFHKAGDQGLAVAQNNVGNALLHGIGVAKDQVEGVRWLRLAADRDVPIAQFNLAVRYYGGIGVQKDPAAATGWALKAAALGHPDAQRWMARAYFSGTDVAKDDTEGLKWLRAAADQGDGDAASSLASGYALGLYGLGKDQTAAMEWIRKSATVGNPIGQAMLGDAYRLGNGTEKNYGEALNWYRKSADQGHVGAMNNLGTMYENGFGVDKDKSAAISWYRKAAEKGAAAARENLKRLGID